MLSDLDRIKHLVTDADVSAGLAGWLSIHPDLDPVPVAFEGIAARYGRAGA